MVTTTFASPLGEILLAADGRGLTGLWFEGQEHFGSTLLKEDAEYVVGADAVSGTGGMSSVSPANGAASSVLERSWAWLNAYFAGQEPRFTPPLHMIGTAFQREVWFELLSIPRGEVATYGEIAQRVAARHRVPRNEDPVVSPRAVGLRSLAIPFRLSCRAIAWLPPTARLTDMPAGSIARSGCFGLRARTRRNARTLCITRTSRKDESLSFRDRHASKRSASEP